MTENPVRTLSLNDRKRLLQEELWHRYGANWPQSRWVSDTATRFQARPPDHGFSDEEYAELDLARDVLEGRGVYANPNWPTQPRDHGKWATAESGEQAAKEKAKKAAEYLDKKAMSFEEYHARGGIGKDGNPISCVVEVKEAWAAQGVHIPFVGGRGSAKDYERVLEDPRNGFEKVAATNKGEGFPPPEREDYNPQIGDVAIIQDAEGHDHGHMQVYTGKEWVANYKQGDKFYPAPPYRSAKTRYSIFRYRGSTRK